MSDSVLAQIRNGNLEELDEYYKMQLNNYTNLYEEYLNKVSGNEDDRIAANADLKPKIIEKNGLLIELAELFLENNKNSLRLIEQDYENIDKKTIQLQKLQDQLNNMDSESFEGDKANEIKGQKRIENIQIYTNRNKTILTVLTIINLLLLAFLVLGVARLVMLNKQNNL